MWIPIVNLRLVRSNLWKHFDHVARLVRRWRRRGRGRRDALPSSPSWGPPPPSRCRSPPGGRGGGSADPRASGSRTSSTSKACSRERGTPSKARTHLGSRPAAQPLRRGTCRDAEHDGPATPREKDAQGTCVALDRPGKPGLQSCRKSFWPGQTCPPWDPNWQPGTSSRPFHGKLAPARPDGHRADVIRNSCLKRGQPRRLHVSSIT